MNQIILDNVIKPIIPYIISPQIKSDLIEPFTIIVKLAIVSYKPVGTKLSVGNNKIVIQEPTFLQGSLRTIQGDKKTDLNILQVPIIFACKTYIERGELNRWIFEKAVQGLQNLRSTYDTDEIVYTITRLTEIIQQYLDNKNIVHLEQTKDVDMKEAIFRNLNTIWDEDAMTIIRLLFERIDTSSGEKRLHYVSSLEEFLCALENDLANIYAYIFKK